MQRLARVDFAPVNYVAMIAPNPAQNAFGQQVMFEAKNRAQRNITLKAITMNDHPQATLVTNPIAGIKTRALSPTKKNTGQNRRTPATQSANTGR